MATIRIPTAMRALTSGRSEVAVSAGTVQEALAALERAHPGIRSQLFDDRGQLRRYVNVFVDEEDIRYLQGLATPLTGAARITLVPAMAGG